MLIEKCHEMVLNLLNAMFFGKLTKVAKTNLNLNNFIFLKNWLHWKSYNNCPKSSLFNDLFLRVEVWMSFSSHYTAKVSLCRNYVLSHNFTSLYNIQVWLFWSKRKRLYADISLVKWLKLAFEVESWTQILIFVMTKDKQSCYQSRVLSLTILHHFVIAQWNMSRTWSLHQKSPRPDSWRIYCVIKLLKVLQSPMVLFQTTYLFTFHHYVHTMVL